MTMSPTIQPEKKNNHHTVYIVDDDSSSRKGLSNLLTVAGFKVESFASVKEFFKIKTIDSHSCLIIDAWVKGFSAEALQTELVKKNDDIPIIFLSARDDKESMDKAIEAKAAGFFRKPVDGPALIDTISWGIKSKKARRNH